MANPRMTTEFNELRVTRLTAATDASLPYERDAGYGTSNHHAPVKFTANKTVGLCEDGDAPFGSLERIEADGSAVVAYEGSVIYAGEATAGLSVVGDGDGGVRAAGEDDTGTGVAGHSAGGKVVVFQ